MLLDNGLIKILEGQNHVGAGASEHTDNDIFTLHNPHCILAITWLASLMINIVFISATSWRRSIV